MTRTLNPTKDRIVLIEKEGENVTPSGIYLPASAVKEPQIGIIEAVGPEAEEDFEQGDEVLFAKYAGTEVDIDDTKYIVLDATDILATLTQDLVGVSNEEVS